MKVFLLLILGVFLLGLLLLPAYWLVKRFNLRAHNRYQLPIHIYLVICLALSCGMLVLMGVDFEGAAVSWFLILMGLNFALCVLCLPLSMGVRIVVRFLHGKLKQPSG